MAARKTGLTLPLQFLAAWLAVWLDRVLQEQVDLLNAENQLLKEKLGTRRLRLTDAERRRTTLGEDQGHGPQIDPSAVMCDILLRLEGAMIKRLGLLVVALLVASCGPARYTVVKQTHTAASIPAAYSVFVGWLNLDERRYQDHGYKSPEEYRKTIAGMNGALQKALRDALPNKRISFAADPTTPPPPDVKIVVLFDDAIADNTSAGMNGHERTMIKTTVRFFEPKTQTALDSAIVHSSVSGIAPFATYNLESCLEQAARNLALYISEKLGSGA